MNNLVSNNGQGLQALKNRLNDDLLKGSNKAEEGNNDLMGQFGDVLKQNLEKVSEMKEQAGALKQDYIVGGNTQLHQVMIASEKASVAMEMTLQVRNKLLQAYQDIMHMPI
jgi:flagellar hook-basal body complex protein FliE